MSTRNAGSLVVTWFDSIYDLTIDSLLFWVKMDSSRTSKSIDQKWIVFDINPGSPFGPNFVQAGRIRNPVISMASHSLFGFLLDFQAFNLKARTFASPDDSLGLPGFATNIWFSSRTSLTTQAPEVKRRFNSWTRTWFLFCGWKKKHVKCGGQIHTIFGKKRHVLCGTDLKLKFISGRAIDW